MKNDAAMPFPLPSAEGKLARDALPILLERLQKSDVCVLGPGLGRSDALTALVQTVVLRSEIPLVLDADALFAVAQDVTVLKRARARCGADRSLAARAGRRRVRRTHGRICHEPDRRDRGAAGGHKNHHPIGGSMQRRSIAALMISLLLLSACGHGAGERSFQTFRDTLTGSLVTMTAQVRADYGHRSGDAERRRRAPAPRREHAHL